jgi:hypothetical protein
MAIYHCSFKHGSKGSGASSLAKADYICREGKYSDKPDLEYSTSGNMPEWAQSEPRAFWTASDQYERANGRVYSEIEVALPREISPEQRQKLVKDFVNEQFGENHPYTIAIHNPPAALDGGEQPHAHIIFSQRKLDGIERNEEQFFKRANAKEPEKGGTAKDRIWHNTEKLQQIRESWERHYNRYSPEKVSCKSLKALGIDREPERHLGPKKTHMDSQEARKIMETREDLKKLEAIKREMVALSREIETTRRDQKKQPPPTPKRQAKQTRPETLDALVQMLAYGTVEMDSVNKIVARAPGEDEAAHRKRLGMYQPVFERAMSERRENLAPRAQVEAELWPARSELARQAKQIEQGWVDYQSRRDPWEQDGKRNSWKYAPPREGFIALAADYLKSPERKAWDKEGKALADEECRLNIEGRRTQDNQERVEQEITTDREGGGQVHHRQIEAAQRDRLYRQLDANSQSITAACADLDHVRLEQKQKQEQDKERARQERQKQIKGLELELDKGQDR